MQKLFTLIIATVAAITASATSSQAAKYYSDTDRVDAPISEEMGQLLDWSNTDRHIVSIYIDNPERFRESFIFTADGCTQKKCSKNATTMSISAKPNGKYRRAVLKVRLVDSQGKYSIVVVNVIKVPYTDDGLIVFNPRPEALLPIR
jgi:hypothetical protein